MVENRIRESLIVQLSLREKAALKAFNKELSFISGMRIGAQDARIAALHGLRGRKDCIRELTAAFRSLYPHWFTNGRGTLADGSEADCIKACLDVIGKLNAGSAHCFSDIMRLFDISGNHVIATGRRPLAYADEGRGKRTRTRTRKANCVYHPERPAVSTVWGLELCPRCYARWNSLEANKIYLADFPGDAIKEVMHLPRPSKARPLYKSASEIKKKHKEREA